MEPRHRYAAWQTWLLVSSLVVSGLRPRLSWSRTASRQFFRHSLTYTMSDWIYSIGNLANPVIVGTWIGAAGVGYVALGTRLVETASFAEQAPDGGLASPRCRASRTGIVSARSSNSHRS